MMRRTEVEGSDRIAQEGIDYWLEGAISVAQLNAYAHESSRIPQGETSEIILACRLRWLAKPRQ